MKKLMIIIGGIIILSTSACRKVTEEYYTYVPNKTVFKNITANQWVSSDNNATYTATISVPEINAVAYDLDATLVYGTFVDGEDEPIPQVFNGVSYHYVVRTGSITIKVQSSDFKPLSTRPGALPIKIVLIASE